ncbi:unnamed protein product [Rhizophagus irregularis]|nr:unnamed protein product [Rhizophagus irregularis]
MGANSPSLWPIILKYRTNYCTFLISFCKKGIRIRRTIQVGFKLELRSDKSRMVSIISVRVLKRVPEGSIRGHLRLETAP